MEIVTMVLSLLGGIALFLFGMSLMGDGLKSVAGNKLEAFLYKMTNTSLKGVALGAGVTSVIQSSSATTVMVIGFVNSGMMKLRQAIGIIMGANIGTSITGWILCLSYVGGSSGIASLFSTATITTLFAFIGICLKTFGKRTTHKNVGNIMLGFAILMTGMQQMSGAVSPLRTNETFISMLTMFSNPIMGILVGILFTAVLQSASAAIGILQALSMTGSLTFAAAFPINLGIGIGAACPVLISALSANKNGKRTALEYLINDLFGMIIWSILFYGSNLFMHYDFLNKVMSPINIALMNTAIRCGNVLVLFWFIPQIEKLLMRIVKDSPEDLAEQADFDLLEERLIPYPALAIAQCHRVMNGMAKKVRNNVNRSMNLINEFRPEKYEKVHRKETLIDKYEARLGSYLMQLTKQALNTEQTRQASLYLHTISDFERIGDHAADIAEMSKSINENRMEMSEAAMDPQCYSSDTATFLLKRIEYGCEGKGYEARSLNEHRIDTEDCMQMSKLTRTLMDAEDYIYNQQKRKENFTYVHRCLSGINKIEPTRYMDEETIPMVYPLVVEDDALIQKLFAVKHFQGHWWSYICEEQSVESFEYWISRYIIPITIDQRYGKEEMDYLVNVIKNK